MSYNVKNLITVVVVFSVSAVFFAQITQAAPSVVERVSGRILLQVEQNGEAWYVNPDNLLRYYMGRPKDAFDLMRLKTQTNLTLRQIRHRFQDLRSKG